MRRLWNRFRCWLIKKLGGIVPGHVVALPKGESVSLPTKVVNGLSYTYTAALQITPESASLLEDPRSIKAELLSKLVELMVRDGNIDFRRSDTPGHFAVDFECSVTVVREGRQLP